MRSGAAWPFQVISVEGAGVTACNGLHVARTGELRLIKIVGAEADVMAANAEGISGVRLVRRV